MLTFLSFSVSKENIEHEVTDCTFCDCKVKWSVALAEFLSYLESITVEATEDVKEIEIDRTDPWNISKRKRNKEKNTLPWD